MCKHAPIYFLEIQTLESVLYFVFFTGIAVSLKKLLTDPDITVRQKATECLFVIGSKFPLQYHIFLESCDKATHISGANNFVLIVLNTVI